MIAYILTSPDGAQSLGFVTGPDQTVGGVACLSGYLDDLSEWTNRVNISRAQGDLPEPIEFSFSLIDWTGLVRRSAGLLDGSVPLIGWRVDAYVSTDGATWNSVNLPGSGLVKFEIVEAAAGGDSIQIQCRERWISNAQAVGFGVGTSRVGLVIGGKQLTVKSPEIDAPLAIKYGKDIGTFFGKPGEEQHLGELSQYAKKWYVFGGEIKYYVLQFWCATAEAANDLLLEVTDAIANNSLFAVGSDYVTQITSLYSASSKTVQLYTNRFFNAVEPDATKIYLVRRDAQYQPVVGGAASATGWVADAGTVQPKGEYKIDSDVLYFAPAITNADGFQSSTIIPCTVGFTAWTTPTVRTVYYGSSASVPTDGTVSSHDSVDANCLPSGGTTASFGLSTSFSHLILSRASIQLAAVPVDPDNAAKYNRIHIDQSVTLTVQNDTLAASSVNYGWQFNSDPDQNSGTIDVGSRAVLGIASNGGVEDNEKQIFDNFADLNASGLFAVSWPWSVAGDMRVYWQLRGMSVYGISTLAFGDSYAVVTPGASPWGANLTPIQAVHSFASAPSGADWSFAAQTSNVISSQWSRFFDAETTTVEAAKTIAQEHWLVLGRGGSEQVIGYGSDILEAPTFTLGDRNDIATEIVIEYDEWEGKYRRKAYVSHVDEAYDPNNSARYFGGWSSDDNPEGYGMAIWNACRKAYQLHGIISSVSLQATSISSGDVLGRMWLSARNGVSRIRWLCLQSRYMSFRVVDQLPTWWAGNTVQVPIAAADLAGYDLSRVEGQYLVCTEKAWNPLTLTTRFELALPPVTSTGTQLRIQQTLDAPDRYIQTLDATDRIIQVQEA